MSSSDHFLPTFDFVEYHSRKIHASPEKAYAALQTIDFHDSLFIRFLFFIRGLRSATFDEARQNFCLLVENPPKELHLELPNLG